MKLWYEQLGFNKNPFSIKPAVHDPDLVAYDMDYIYEKIDNSEILFIEGPYGSGKTTMLKNIIKRYQGNNRIIYYSFNKAEDFQPKELIKGANSLLRKLTGLKVKNMIMLLDEVQTMSKKDARRLLKFYREGTVKSIVLVSHDYEIIELPEEFESLLDGNVLLTVKLSLKEAEELMERRMGDIDLFPTPMVHKIFKLADRNPRRFLEYAEDVARYAVEIGDRTVTEFHVEEVLNHQKTEIAETVEEEPLEKKPAADEKETSVEETIEIVELDTDETPKVEEVEQPSQEDSKKDTMTHTQNYKINSLVGDEGPKLGKISEKEVPEYQIYYLDE